MNEKIKKNKWLIAIFILTLGLLLGLAIGIYIYLNIYNNN